MRDDFERFLELFYQGEVAGEVFMRKIAEGMSSPEHERKLRMVEELERTMQGRVADVMRKRGLVPSEDETYTQHLAAYGTQLGSLGWDELMKALSSPGDEFVRTAWAEEIASVLARVTEETAPPDGRAIFRILWPTPPRPRRSSRPSCAATAETRPAHRGFLEGAGCALDVLPAPRSR